MVLYQILSGGGSPRNHPLFKVLKKGKITVYENFQKKHDSIFVFLETRLFQGRFGKRSHFSTFGGVVVTWCDSDDDDDDSDVGANCGVPIKAIIPPSVNSGQT